MLIQVHDVHVPFFSALPYFSIVRPRDRPAQAQVQDEHRGGEMKRKLQRTKPAMCVRVEFVQYLDHECDTAP